MSLEPTKDDNGDKFITATGTRLKKDGIEFVLATKDPENLHILYGLIFGECAEPLNEDKFKELVIRPTLQGETGEC